ncbi:hypothetical protein RHMOL_Rhmol11G0114400 [Rhododendron molle]|uniref:Uncharacterized protein n=1 Tax=Rhododendron molle TaxID=49168 RepID=A0ACC0LS82_RHOML|nr:hypothetical protein RHMOL_Rhmol11G0114400 [Rhododendron molle]
MVVVVVVEVVLVVVVELVVVVVEEVVKWWWRWWSGGSGGGGDGVVEVVMVKLLVGVVVCSRLNYAKICVEVGVDSALPDRFDLVSANGDKFAIRVWYPWKPLKCSKCKVFGHKNCHETSGGAPQVDPKQIWVAKRSQNVLEHAVIQKDPNKLVLSAVTIVPEEGMVSVPNTDGSLVVESGPIDMTGVPVVELVRGRPKVLWVLKLEEGLDQQLARLRICFQYCKVLWMGM